MEKFTFQWGLYTDKYISTDINDTVGQQHIYGTWMVAFDLVTENKIWTETKKGNTENKTQVLALNKKRNVCIHLRLALDYLYFSLGVCWILLNYWIGYDSIALHQHQNNNNNNTAIFILCWRSFHLLETVFSRICVINLSLYYIQNKCSKNLLNYFTFSFYTFII